MFGVLERERKHWVNTNEIKANIDNENEVSMRQLKTIKNINIFQ